MAFFNFNLTIGDNAGVIRGYRDETASQFGALSPDTINGQKIARLQGNNTNGICALRMTEAGEQIPGAQYVTWSIGGLEVQLNWDAGTSEYRGTSTDIAAYLDTNNGTTVSTTLDVVGINIVINLNYGQQFNIERVPAELDQFVFNFPSGQDGRNPTGVRNLSNTKQTVTMNAQAGEGFWDASQQTALNTLEEEIWPNTQRMWVYRPGRGWVLQVDTVVAEAVPALYGWGDQTTDVPLFNIPALTYVTMPIETAYPTAPFAPRGVTINPTNDTIALQLAGPWLIGIDFNLVDHDESQQGRTVIVRFFNVTAAAPIPGGFTIGIGRNVVDTYQNTVFPAQIPETAVNDELRVEIGGADAVTGGTLTNARVWAAYMAELGSLI